MDISNIAKVYNGKIGCMCGCLGKYSYNENASQEDGYGDVSVRSVKIIAKKVLTNPNVVFENDYAYVEDRDRNKMQVVYFNA